MLRFKKQWGKYNKNIRRNNEYFLTKELDVSFKDDCGHQITMILDSIGYI